MLLYEGKRDREEKNSYLDLYLRLLSTYMEWVLEAKSQSRPSTTPTGLRMVENKEIMFNSTTY